MPAGLGVWVVSPNALKRGLALIDKYPLHQGAHNRISDFHKNYKTYQTPSTPNIMGIYMLCEICKTYNHLGGLSYLKKINEQQRAFFDKEISEINGLEFSITNSDYRSKTIAVLKYAEPKRLIEALKKRDITISKGYGDFEEQHIRIGIFPHHEMESIRHLIEALKSCLN
jgi:phosphoserine aminotransferase